MNFSKNSLILAAMVALCGTSLAHAQTASVKIDMSGSIKPGTCDFGVSNVQAVLGDYDYTAFTGVGFNTPWVKIPLKGTCKGVKNIKGTFSGTADKDNGDLYQVAGGAAGVGIELQVVGRGSGLMTFPAGPGKDMTWDAVDSASGDLNLQARYKQTLETVVSGKANATVTLAFVYQ